MKKIIITPVVEFSPTEQKLVGSIDLSSLKKEDMPISFDLATYRLVDLNQVLKEDSWLVEIFYLADEDLISLSIGGEYIGDIELSELEDLLLRAILL